MCGISGFYNIKGQSVKEDLLKEFIKLQDHRGPDSNGYFYNGSVGMAHNRLSLIDLSDNGRQPFEDDRYVLIFNGEIYNYLQIKNELSNQQFNSSSDTAVLFQALREWGIKRTVNKLRGMFAFAWYDKAAKKMILARDRLGIKPLFWSKINGTICFASELKAILKVNDFELNHIKTLYSTLGILEKSNKSTAWKGIYHLSPGTFMEIDEKEQKETKYFEITNYVDESEYNRLKFSSVKDVVDEFECLFDSAIKSCLIADAPLGAFVSGGIDSSLIAAYAAKYSNDFKLFSADVDGAYSEINDARFLAKSINCDLYEYNFKPDMAIRDFVDVTWHYESPLVTHFNALPFSNVSELTKKHGVKAVLTGEGADELFLGYPRLLTKRYDSLLNMPFALLKSIYNVHPALKSYMTGGGSSGIDGFFEQSSQAYERQLMREDTIPAYSFLPEKKQMEHYMSAQMMKEGIVSLLWRNDRMGMMHSIESRFPFLDEDILKFAMNLPTKFKIGRTSKFYNFKHPFLTDKFVVRKLGDRKLPSRIAHKKKKGFPTYGLNHLKVPKDFFYNGFVQDLLGFQKKQVDYMVDNFSPYHIGKFVALEIWGQLFVMKTDKEVLNKVVNESLTMNIK